MFTCKPEIQVIFGQQDFSNLRKNLWLVFGQPHDLWRCEAGKYDVS